MARGLGGPTPPMPVAVFFFFFMDFVSAGVETLKVKSTEGRRTAERRDGMGGWAITAVG